MSWGKGIALLLISFMTMITYFVVRSFQQDFHLVTNNYYEESLAHDDIQNYRSNYKNLNENVIQIQNDSAATLAFQLPASFDGKPIDGSLYLYRPTDEKKDQNIDFKDSKIAISTESLDKGMWHVKLRWKSEEKIYLFESSIFIRKQS